MAIAVLLTGCGTADQSTALSRLNQDRTANHVAPLIDSGGDLQAKAQAWAEKLAGEGALYHSQLTDRLTRRYCALGENIAQNGYGSIDFNELLFEQSPGHQANNISSAYNDVGVGIARRGGAVWTVLDFGGRC